MKKTLIDFYNEKSFTHNYIFGVAYKGKVYAIKTTSAILPYVLTVDKASRGQGCSLRFKPNNEQRLTLIAEGAEVLCSVEYLEKLFDDSVYNRGEIFEKLVTERYGQVWEKDRVPFNEAGDLEVDGVAYQIKYEKASFISEGQMVRMRAEA